MNKQFHETTKREGAPPSLPRTQKYNNDTITVEQFTAIVENYDSKVVRLPQLRSS